MPSLKKTREMFYSIICDLTNMVESLKEENKKLKEKIKVLESSSSSDEDDIMSEAEILKREQMAQDPNCPFGHA
jgi:acetyl-CoA carboxylase alpha subunit